MRTGRKSVRRRGSTLVLITAIGVVISLLGMAMIHLGYQARILAVRNVQGITARCAADAGMAEAIYKMQCKIINEAVWNDGNIPSATDAALAGASSTYTYAIVKPSYNLYRVDSTGYCGPVSKVTHVNLKVGSYWEGIGVERYVTVHAYAQFGAIGPYAADGVEIRSNSTGQNDMIFYSGVTVPGDIVSGPGSDPNYVVETKNNVVVTGEVYAADEQLIFPDVQPPAATPSGFIDIPNSGNMVLSSAGSFLYNGINIGQNGTLRITADVTLYVPYPYKMVLNQGAKVIIESGGSLDLYLGTSLEDKNSSGQATEYGFINGNGDATKLKIYGLPTCSQIDLKAKSDLFAAVYAPDSVVTIFNEGTFTGAVTAYDFYMKNSGNFIFDTALKDVNIDDPAAVFVINRWWEG